MTKVEKENIKKWNIEMGKSREESEHYFCKLQNICRSYSLPVTCNPEINLQNIIKCSVASEADKNNSMRYYASYNSANGKWEALTRFLTIVGNC